MSDHTPQSEAETHVLTAIRNDDYKAWQSLLDGADIQAATANRAFAAAVYEAVLMRALGNLAFDAAEQAELERVRIAFNIPEEEATAIKARRARKALKALAKHLYTDRVLTPAERGELEALGAELTLSKDEVTRIIGDVMGA